MGIGPRKDVLLGANLGRAIVINGDFTAYVWYSAATRPFFQITLGKLVIIIIIIIVVVVVMYCTKSVISESVVHDRAP